MYTHPSKYTSRAEHIHLCKVRILLNPYDAEGVRVSCQDPVLTYAKPLYTAVNRTHLA